MPTLTDTTASTQSTGTHRIILASALRRKRHSASRQARAVKTLRKMSRFDDSFEMNGDRCRIETGEELLDE
jgi:hypothetical protein